MAINKHPRRGTISGVQSYRSKNVEEVMRWSGFDPDEDGSEWALLATDIHFAASGTLVKSLDYRLRDVLTRLRATPPDRTVILGDVLTYFVPAFGQAKFTGYTVYGNPEVAWWNSNSHFFSDLGAPVTMVLGNHDTPRNETPSLGAFMAANANLWSGLNHSFSLGGVKWICISTDHGAGWKDGQGDYYAARLAEVTTEEVAVCMHQPGGGRASDWHGFYEMLNRTPPTFANQSWMFAGHDHIYTDYCRVFGATTLLVSVCGAGLPISAFGDFTNPALTAVACRDGKVVGRFACDCKDGYWYLVTPANRSNPSNSGTYLSPLSAYALLTSYHGGTHDLTTFAVNTEGDPRWRYTGTWFAYAYDLDIKFPIPVGATKMWVCLLHVPSVGMWMSNDGATWTPVTHSASPTGFIVIDIPVGLQGGLDLYIRLQSASNHISGFGFIA